MANGNSRSIAPMRKLFAGVLGTIAVFVALFGLGMGSLAIVALGLAMLVLSIALVLVTAVRGGARAWVAGSAHVVSASEPPANSTYGRCELQIVVEAPGVPAAAVKIRDPRVPVSKWPDAGATLPIMVAIDDPRHVRVQWDEVLTHAEAAAEEELDGRHDGHTEEQRGYDPGPPRDDDLIPGLDDADPDDGSPDLEKSTVELREEAARARRDEPVVITQTAIGPVVEGRVVEQPAPEGDAPRVPRPRPRPHPRRPRPPRAAAEPPAAEPGAEAEGATDGGIRTAVVAEGSGAADATDGGVRTAVAADGPDPGPVDDAALADLITAYPGARPGATGSIHGVGVTMLVADLDRSVAFYRDMLGFFEIDGGEGNAVLTSGDTRLVLRTVRDSGPVQRRVVHLNLEVGDVEAVYRELKDKGVRFTYGPRPVNRGARLEQWAAAFRDPDGHGIALTQWRGRTGR